MVPSLLRSFLAAIPLVAQAAPCATDLASLRALLGDNAFPLEWHETTMDDGKPLVLSFVERGGRLGLEFAKSGQGLWAEGLVVLCVRGTDLEARFPAEGMRLGPAAHWAMRLSVGADSAFLLTRLGPHRMRVATSGWSGTFAWRDPR